METITHCLPLPCLILFLPERGKLSQRRSFLFLLKIFKVNREASLCLSESATYML